MTARDFAFWLQGYFELTPDADLNPAQIETIKRHLALVFIHDIDPAIGGDAAHLQAVHDGPPAPGHTEAWMAGPDLPGGIRPRC